MAISEDDLKKAEERLQERREAGYAVSARYDKRSGRLVVEMSTDVQIAVPANNLEGLSEALPEQLAEIEVTEAGLGLHWPQLDVDIYIPSLLQGTFGSRQWMAAQFGAAGGASRSDAKARENGGKGGKGGRPRKSASS